MKIDAIRLDAAGTLIRLTRPEGETYTDIAAEFGGVMDPDAIDAAFRKAWFAMPPQLEAPGTAQTGRRTANSTVVPPAHVQWDVVLRARVVRAPGSSR